VQGEDLLLDGAARDEAVDGDGLGLADAVGAVARLVLDGTGAAAAMKTDELLALLQAGEADEPEEGVAEPSEG
jgi:hypothetical protein